MNARNSKASGIKTMREKAIRTIATIGRACGFQYVEIVEITKLIDLNAENYATDYRKNGIESNSIRITYSAIVAYRKSKLVWYKPWIQYRLLRIQKRYCDWWVSIDETAGVASRFVPDSFAV